MSITSIFDFNKIQSLDGRTSFISTNQRTLIFEQGYIIGIPFNGDLNEMLNHSQSFTLEMRIGKVIVPPCPSPAYLDICD